MDEISSSLLKQQLGLMIDANGNLAQRIQQFKEKYSGREYQRGMTELVLLRLQIISVEGVDVIAGKPKLEEFKTLNHRLLDILTEIGAGGVYDQLLEYSKRISKLPHAQVGKEKLHKWAKNLKVAVSEVMFMCRLRKNSANPPY